MTDPMELAGRATAFGTDEHRSDIIARLERETPFSGWGWGNLTRALSRYLRRWTDARHASVYRDRGIWGPSPLLAIAQTVRESELVKPWANATADEIIADLAALTKRARCELSGQGPCLECAECERHGATG